MELHPTKCEIVPEDDEYLAYAYFQSEASYFTIQRFTSRAPCDASQIESERDEQTWSTRVDPESCELGSQNLLFRFGPKAAADLGGISSVTIAFPAAHLSVLKKTLAEIFRDRPCYRDLAPEIAEKHGANRVAGSD